MSGATADAGPCLRFGSFLPMDILRTLVLLAFAAGASAATPLPDHLPEGAGRPLETGDSFTLLAALAHDAPDFASPARFVRGGRHAELLGAEGGFYHLRLESSDGEAAETLWIWRSELGLSELDRPATKPAAPRWTDGFDVSKERPAAPPAAGDTLKMANPVLYGAPDLFGEHRLVGGRCRAVVLAAESAAGFLEVDLGDDGGRGWLHRGELPESQRRPLDGETPGR